MNRALKFAMMLSGIIVLFYAAMMIVGRFISIENICILIFIFLFLTVFFWISYIVGQLMFKGEKKIWRWLNTDEYSKSTKLLNSNKFPSHLTTIKRHTPSDNLRFKLKFIEDFGNRQLYKINGDVLRIFNEEFAKKEVNLPYSGMTIYPQEDFENLVYFIRTSRFPLSKNEIKSIYKEWLDGKYDLVFFF